jgi:uncharacterized protein RhaS with RHS repeats
VYDPNTGRLTQEDPIGLAGGENGYGFADGDPVNFADPFGLAKCKASETENCEDAGGASDGSGAGTDTTKTRKPPEEVRSTLESVGDFAAGFGDFVTLGGTKWVREHWKCGECVKYSSGIYTAGQVTGGVAGVARDPSWWWLLGLLNGRDKMCCRWDQAAKLGEERYHILY